MSIFSVTWSNEVEKLLPPVLRDGDFIALNHDFKAGNPVNNYIEYIIVSSPGHWKEFPIVGVGIINYLQGTQSPQILQRNISLELRSDSNIFRKPKVDVSKFPTIVVNEVEITIR